MAQRTYAVEAIYTFADDRDQEFFDLTVDSNDRGEICEGTMLLALLQPLNAKQLQQLCKISTCIAIDGEEAAAAGVAPFLFDKDSPLHNGKLWLKQFNPAVAIGVC